LDRKGTTLNPIDEATTDVPQRGAYEGGARRANTEAFPVQHEEAADHEKALGALNELG